MSVFVDSDLDCYVDLCQGASLSSLELEDDWMLTWKEVSVCYLVVVPVNLMSLLVDRKMRFFSCWEER